MKKLRCWACMALHGAAWHGVAWQRAAALMPSHTLSSATPATRPCLMQHEEGIVVKSLPSQVGAAVGCQHCTVRWM